MKPRVMAALLFVVGLAGTNVAAQTAESFVDPVGGL